MGTLFGSLRSHSSFLQVSEQAEVRVVLLESVRFVCVATVFLAVLCSPARNHLLSKASR